MSENPYDEMYDRPGYYWGMQPSRTCYEVLKNRPPVEPLTVLVLGCGEGRNAVFLARNGYEVSAFDLSPKGLEKTERLAHEAGVSIDTFQADINEFRLQTSYDVLFSTGVLHFIRKELRDEIFENYKEHTERNGLNVLSVFVDKPFIPDPPDHEEAAQIWHSGELFTHYHDWKISYCVEEIIACNSGGIPHRHAMNRMVAVHV